MADQQLDHLHTLSSKLIREKQTVVPEDLNVSGMAKNHKLARAIADAGWRLFRTLLESKVRLYGRQVRIISRWQPTSQACCACGHKGGKNALSVRARRCAACGTEHQRAVPAAQNILAAGQAVKQEPT